MLKKREPRKQVSFRMTKTAYDLLQKLARDMGVGRGAVLEFALRMLDAKPVARRPKTLKYTEAQNG